jgi:hypothetical protein
MEKEYADLTEKAKRGINKFCSMSSIDMRKFSEKFEQTHGKNPNNVHFKDEFYEFIEDQGRSLR